MIHWHIIWYLLGVWDVSFSCILCCILFFDKPLMFEDFPWSLCMQHVCFPITTHGLPLPGNRLLHRSRRKKVNHVGILKRAECNHENFMFVYHCIPMIIPWIDDNEAKLDFASHENSDLRSGVGWEVSWNLNIEGFFLMMMHQRLQAVKVTPDVLRCMDLSCTHGSDFIAAVPNAPYKLHACCLQGRLHIINPVGTDRNEKQCMTIVAHRCCQWHDAVQ